MTIDNEPEQLPLALHVRRLRRWYGESGLSQGRLADLAGVSARHLRRFESTTVLPQAVQSLLRIAIALNVPFESLLDAEFVDELRADIEARRAERGLTRPTIGFEGDRHAE